jgi:hypothetical protein
MPKPRREPIPKPSQDQLSLSLKLETTDRNKPNVDADDFFLAAEKMAACFEDFCQGTG